MHAGDFHGWVSSGYLADGTPPQPAAVAARAESADNWMEALIPQVDPTGTATGAFRRNGSWGASDGHTNYIDPEVPADKRFSVMVHELSHVMQVQVYGSLTKAVAAMSAITGSSPSDVSSNEQTADCMALMLGATWINYGCPIPYAARPRHSWPATARNGGPPSLQLFRGPVRTFAAQSNIKRRQSPDFITSRN